jgi:signal transduction histidine kinase/SAM-dependent methyltransferase
MATGQRELVLAIIRDDIERDQMEQAQRESEQHYQSLFASARTRPQTLGEISRAVSSVLDVGQMLATIARHAAKLGGADAAGVYQVDETQQMLDLAASYNASPSFVNAADNAKIKIGQGVVGRAVASLLPVQSVNAPTDSIQEFTSGLSEAGYNSVVAVPMFDHGKPVGAIVLWSEQCQTFGENVVELLMTLADQSVVAIESAHLYREARRRLDQVSIVQAVALAGAAGKPFDDIVADATGRLRRLWQSHHLGFLFPDEVGALRIHESSIGVSPEIRHKVRILPGTGITGWVFETGQSILIPDVRNEPRYIEVNPHTLSEMAAPLIASGRVIGVVNVESTRLDTFSSEDVDLLAALAGQLAIILDNVQARRELAVHVRQLQRAYDELAEAERLKDQMVQNISHELRTPMTYIKGYTDLMLAEAFGPLPVGLREFVEIVSRKADSLAHLIERIVALQATGAEDFHFEPVKLSDLAQDVIERWRSQAQQVGLELAADLPDDLPMIACDRRQLVEVLGNLMSNAVKFSGRGGRVKLAAHREAGLVHIEVADNGIGIPPDKLGRVFDRFYQVDGTTRRQFGGAGVGLALVQRIVEAHGGRAWAESAGSNQGSKFHVMLPVALSA